MSRVIVAIDPSQRKSGVAVMCAETGRLRLCDVMREPIGIADAEAALRVLRLHTGGRQWIGVVEKAPPTRVGTRSAPTSATRAWMQLLRDLARATCADPLWPTGAIDTRRKLPTIARPTPSMWRSPLGITSGPREAAKAQAIRYAQLLGVTTASHDAAEAVCMAEWARRLLPFWGTKTHWIPKMQKEIDR